jgi:hypothetical protein
VGRGEAHLLQSVVGGEPAEPEVEDHGVPLQAGPGDHDVLGLEVAMDDALRVRAGQGVEHLRHEADRLALLQGALVVHHLAECCAGNEGEDGEQRPVAQLAGIAEADDVRMGEGGAEPHLAPEPLRVAL